MSPSNSAAKRLPPSIICQWLICGKRCAIRDWYWVQKESNAKKSTRKRSPICSLLEIRPSSRPAWAAPPVPSGRGSPLDASSSSCMATTARTKTRACIHCVPVYRVPLSTRPISMDGSNVELFPSTCRTKETYLSIWYPAHVESSLAAENVAKSVRFAPRGFLPTRTSMPWFSATATAPTMTAASRQAITMYIAGMRVTVIRSSFRIP
mmetsp:Transcript_76642/g.173361  ORF Transcript_76642/g.173361 Transcript_76642/m.173361 type:complete len:208 (-) Transcript_76642:1100-1723(-)